MSDKTVLLGAWDGEDLDAGFEVDDDAELGVKWGTEYRLYAVCVAHDEAVKAAMMRWVGAILRYRWYCSGFTENSLTMDDSNAMADGLKAAEDAYLALLEVPE